MHTLKKTFLTLALALAFVSAEAAQNTGRIMIPESKLKFKANEDYTEVTITGCTLGQNDYRQANGKWLEIPSKIQGVPVTKIGDEAFSFAGDSSYKVGLWIPDGITELGKTAFYYSQFISIRLPEGLKEIPGAERVNDHIYIDGCFCNCSAKSINIPSTVEYIGAEAFYYCKLEEAVIPAGCKICTCAFSDSGIKKLTFPKGRIYFDIKLKLINDRSLSLPFKDCDSLETIVIPKELDVLYRITNYGSPVIYDNLKLSDFIMGDKINDNFALQKSLKAVNVRDKYKVEGEEALDAYNKAVSEKNWDQARSIAQNTYTLFYTGQNVHYEEYKEWSKRVTDANCTLYDKAMSEKNWAQAKSIAQNTSDFFYSFHSKSYSNNDKKEYEEWEDRITDVNCAQYFPALADKILKLNGTVVKENGSLIYRIDLTDDICCYSDKICTNGFILKDDSGKEVDVISNNKFSQQFKQKTGFECKVNYYYDDNYSAKYYIYRNPTEAELSAYNKNRKDAVKAFLDTITPDGNYSKEQNNLTFDIRLPDGSYSSYNKETFYVNDASGNKQEFTESEFLKLVKEITGFDYEINYSPYRIRRNATEAETAAYNQNRKDAVKTFIDTITPSGSVVNDRDSICFDVKLPKGSYKSGTIYVNDASGKKQEFTESEFEKIVKEITGIDYEINYSPYRIRRNATEAETAAYNQNRKDAVKAFIDTITPKGSFVQGRDTLRFCIALPNNSYRHYLNGPFYANDASGNKQEFTTTEFLGLVKEITGFDYHVDYNNGAFIYRDATEAETAAYNQNRKDAVKTFIEKITPNEIAVKDGSSLTFEIALPDGSYNYRTFYVNDAAGKKQEFTERDFLGLVKEITGFNYEINANRTIRIYRYPTTAERTAYDQARKEAVKTFYNTIVPTGSVILSHGAFRIPLPEESCKGRIIYISDASGEKHVFKESEFLTLIKEITGFRYSLNYNYSNDCFFIIRSATESEVDALKKHRKDTLKAFIETITPNGKVIKEGSNFSFWVDIPKEAYTDSTFYVKDTAGKNQSFTESDFIKLVREVTGLYYKGNNNNGTYYLYRAATEEEILNNKKHAMRTFFNGISADGKLAKNGKKDVYTIPLPDGSYSEKNNTFSMIDAAGNTLAIPESDFLAFTKEESTFTYYVGKIQDGTFCIFREPNREEKIGIAFNEGTLHTNLATIKFEDKNGVVTIKGFTEKKTAFENAGLKVKDEVKKITVKTEDGEEKEISLADLAGLHPVPTKTVTFTVERTEKKNVQTLTFSAAVEWNEKDLKKIK